MKGKTAYFSLSVAEADERLQAFVAERVDSHKSASKRVAYKLRISPKSTVTGKRPLWARGRNPVVRKHRKHRYWRIDLRNNGRDERARLRSRTRYMTQVVLSTMKRS